LSLIAGFAVALAPVQRDAAEIRHRLVKPIVAVAGIVALLIAAYSYAGKKYDLDKGILPEQLVFPMKHKTVKRFSFSIPQKSCQ
jgi:hypothetical protein